MTETALAMATMAVAYIVFRSMQAGPRLQMAQLTPRHTAVPDQQDAPRLTGSYSRLGGMFGRRREDDPDPRNPQQPWRLPGGLGGYEYGADDEPGQVRVLPPEAPAQAYEEPAQAPVPPPEAPVAPQREVLTPYVPAQRFAPPAQPPAPEPEPVVFAEEDSGFGDLLPMAESERLERWTELFRQQSQYYSEAAAVVDQHTRALSVYLQEQRVNMQRMMGKLENQLRPLKEYIATEQANLDKLKQTMERQPSGLVASHFQDYMRAQQDRIDRGKEEVATRYQPFQEYFAEQQNLVETLLSKFDDDFKKLSSTLTEQRRLVERVQKGLTDGDYASAMDFMTERQRAWVDFTRSTGEDPAVVYERLNEIHAAFSANSKVSGVLDHLFSLAQAADERLAEYVRPMNRQAPARPAGSPPAAPEPLGDAAGFGSLLPEPEQAPLGRPRPSRRSSLS